MTADTSHSSTHNLCITYLITSHGILSNVFSKSTKPKQSLFLLSLKFSCICLKIKMASVVPFPFINANRVSSVSICCHSHTQPFYSSVDSVRDKPGEPKVHFAIFWIFMEFGDGHPDGFGWFQMEWSKYQLKLQLLAAFLSPCTNLFNLDISQLSAQLSWIFRFHTEGLHLSTMPHLPNCRCKNKLVEHFN